MADPSHPPSPPMATHAYTSLFHTAKTYGGKPQMNVNSQTEGCNLDLEHMFIRISFACYTHSDWSCISSESPYPPGLTALLIAVPNPLRPLPLLFSSVLGLSSCLSFSGYHIDAAGISAAWSALYIIAASRRKQNFIGKFSRAGVLRGMTVGACALNVLAGGLAYAFGQRSKEDERIRKGGNV
ncbi:hypothetical protein FGG08_002086 [Glutinoglossum americanum]|uniref:Uncharacterized protein n=1 Tax=Glutinoglossum americanum TaxID=1670608 RepID=A0A9P8L4T5_9PEZI|nr:hypothetical protein FGG08_002086 [Glutinoglossum americanum]